VPRQGRIYVSGLSSSRDSDTHDTQGTKLQEENNSQEIYCTLLSDVAAGIPEAAELLIAQQSGRTMELASVCCAWPAAVLDGLAELAMSEEAPNTAVIALQQLRLAAVAARSCASKQTSARSASAAMLLPLRCAAAAAANNDAAGAADAQNDSTSAAAKRWLCALGPAGAVALGGLALECVLSLIFKFTCVCMLCMRMHIHTNYPACILCMYVD
jgi:hypothetical protein